MSEHNIDVREVKSGTKPSGTEQIEVRMKVDDTYVIFKSSGPDLKQGFTKAWGNPSINPTKSQKKAGKHEAKKVISERV